MIVLSRQKLKIFVSRPKFLLTVGVLLGALFCIIQNPIEKRVLQTGAALQFAGVLTIAWGIRQTRKDFGLPGLVDYGREWLREIINGPKTQIICATGISSSASVGGASITIEGYAPTLTLEGRIAALEANQKSLEERLDRVASDTQRRISDQVARLAVEIENRERGDRDQAERLKRAHTGGLTLSVAGTTWVLVGTILSGFPDWITCLFSFGPVTSCTL